jgi:hypothetical protein
VAVKVKIREQIELSKYYKRSFREKIMEQDCIDKQLKRKEEVTSKKYQEMNNYKIKMSD